MNNRFKILKLLRIITTLAAIVVCSDILITVYTSTDNELIGIFSLDFVVMLACGLVLVYCAISFNKIEYEIKDQEVVFKDIMRKDRSYAYSEIEEIEEARAWPFRYMRLVLKNNKKRSIMPLNNKRDFLVTMQEKIMKCRESREF